MPPRDTASDLAGAGRRRPPMFKEFAFARCGFFRCIYLAAQQVRRATIAAFRKAWQSAGLPVGLQLVGKPYAEHLLLNVAAAYEKATPWHSKRPSLDRINPDENPQVAVPLARDERSLVAFAQRVPKSVEFLCRRDPWQKTRSPTQFIE
jgi:hypothetical protein